MADLSKTSQAFRRPAEEMDELIEDVLGYLARAVVDCPTSFSVNTYNDKRGNRVAVAVATVGNSVVAEGEDFEDISVGDLLGVGTYGTWTAHGTDDKMTVTNAKAASGVRSARCVFGTVVDSAFRSSMCTVDSDYLDLTEGVVRTSHKFAYTSPPETVDFGIVTCLAFLATATYKRSAALYFIKEQFGSTKPVIMLSDGPPAEVKEFGNGASLTLGDLGDGEFHTFESEFDLAGTFFRARVDSGTWVNAGDGTPFILESFSALDVISGLDKFLICAYIAGSGAVDPAYVDKIIIKTLAP